MIKDIEHTNRQFDTQAAICRQTFREKLVHHSVMWQTLRPKSIIEFIWQKVMQIREFEEAEKEPSEIVSRYVELANDSILALIKFENGEAAEKRGFSPDETAHCYDSWVQNSKDLMLSKNHDYGEAWRDMRVSTFTDLILMKLLRIKEIQNNDGKTIISEGVDAGYQDIFNYSMFALIRMEENTVQS